MANIKPNFPEFERIESVYLKHTLKLIPRDLHDEILLQQGRIILDPDSNDRFGFSIRIDGISNELHQRIIDRILSESDS